MKLFQNPIVVTILAGLALGMVGRNVLLPIIKRNGGTSSHPRAAAAPAKAPAVSVKSESTPAQQAGSANQPLAQKPSEITVLPSANIDVSGVWKASMQWTASPRRDPFQLEKRKADGPSARDLLKLSGTWRQTDGTLAVLNNQVVYEGESILGFRVEAVEVDRVWVEGPNGRESIEFKLPVSDVPAKLSAVLKATNSAESGQKE